MGINLDADCPRPQLSGPVRPLPSRPIFYLSFVLPGLSDFKMLSAVLRRRAVQSTSSFSYQFARCYASKSFPPHTVVTMPALSPTMTAGNIGTWQKKVGDAIAPGDVLVEIETDKAQMDFEFQEDGVLAKILKQSGEKDIAVGNPIAVMVGEGEDASAFESFTLEDAGGESAPPPPPKEEASESSEPADTQSGTAPPKAESTPAPEQPVSSGGRLQPALERAPNASAAAVRLAIETGVKIAGLKGSTAAPGAAPAASYTDTPISSMRKTIANRLTESMNQNPHYFVAASVSVTKLMKLRAALNASADG